MYVEVGGFFSWDLESRAWLGPSSGPSGWVSRPTQRNNVGFLDNLVWYQAINRTACCDWEQLRCRFSHLLIVRNDDHGWVRNLMLKDSDPTVARTAKGPVQTKPKRAATMNNDLFAAILENGLVHNPSACPS
jgi:hypothetical protein